MTKATAPGLAFALGLTASLAFAQSPTNAKAPIFDPAKSGVKVVFAPEKSEAPATSAGQRGHVDGQGKLKEPDPEETQSLGDLVKAQTQSTPAASLVPFNGPAGTVGFRLGEDFMEALTVTVGPDGKLVFQCGPAAKTPRNATAAAPVSKSTGKENLDVK